MHTGRSALVAVLAGALALGAFTAQPAQAVAADTGIEVSNVVVNEGKPMVVGTTETKYPTFSYRVTWPAGYTISTASTSPFMYHGMTPAKANETSNQLIQSDMFECFEDGPRAANCSGHLRIRPRENLDSAKDATTWKMSVIAFLERKGRLDHEYLTTPATLQVKRAARVTVNASPEPVVKNKTLTVTGKLTRADWAKRAYSAYGGKLAKLQFRKAGTSTYTTVKTVRANSSGNLKTTVKATVDGYWRWTFGQTATTGGATAAGDYVDVK
ncbi:hypothetical protein [Streptomyces sp. enrichment culture]|uniref:hypothetical protein n=1 Tax=Streptomyces sp. enrichment culture TaxID=1795815 RepID=UPI003F553AAC